MIKISHFILIFFFFANMKLRHVIVDLSKDRSTTGQALLIWTMTLAWMVDLGCYHMFIDQDDVRDHKSTKGYHISQVGFGPVRKSSRIRIPGNRLSWYNWWKSWFSQRMKKTKIYKVLVTSIKRVGGSKEKQDLSNLNYCFFHFMYFHVSIFTTESIPSTTYVNPDHITWPWQWSKRDT